MTGQWIVENHGVDPDIVLDNDPIKEYAGEDQQLDKAIETALQQIKDRKPLLKGRCAKCKWLENCNGNFRTRAEARTGDFWESDPSCYLTDEEIGLTEEPK